MIAQKATERANSGASTTFFTGFNQDGTSSFRMENGSLGQILNENPGLFKNLMNQHGSSDLGKEIFMSRNRFATARDGMAVMNGIMAVTSIPGLIEAPFAIANLASGLRAARLATVADGSYYSVAYEMELGAESYPGVSRYMHFKEANISLNAAMETNPALSKLGISVPRSPTGSIIGKSPTGWVWHHDIETGVMQLVPKAQHPNIPGGIFWETMHPGGVGGYSIWGQ